MSNTTKEATTLTSTTLGQLFNSSNLLATGILDLMPILMPSISTHLGKNRYLETKGKPDPVHTSEMGFRLKESLIFRDGPIEGIVDYDLGVGIFIDNHAVLDSHNLPFSIDTENHLNENELFQI